VCLNIATAAFSLFRRKLDGTAKQQWDMIDTEVHSDSTHTDLQGLTVDGPKGRFWVRFFSALKSADAADEQRRVTHSVSPRSSVQRSSVTAARITEELTPPTTQHK